MKQQHNEEKKEDLNGAYEAFICEILQSAKSITLKKLLAEKKVKYRSKLTSKEQMISVLSPIVTNEDLNKIMTDLGINLPIPTQNQFAKESPVIQQNEDTFNYPKEGMRYNGAVMGVDVHKDTLVCAIVDSTGIVYEKMFENSVIGFESILKLIRTYHCEAVAMESTGEYWFKFSWFLQDAKVPILVANPQQTKATQGVKTDQHDARRIAIAFRDGRLKPSVTCNRWQFELRKLGRSLLQYIGQETNYKNRINKILIKCENGGLVYELFSSDRGFQLVSDLCGCESFEDFFECVKKAYSKGRGKTRKRSDLMDKARKYWSVREELIYNQSYVRFVLEFTSLCQAKEKTTALELMMGEMITENKETEESLHLLLSIPSVGKRTALILVAEIVDIRFFSSSKKFVKWCGLAPRVNQSGYKKRNNGHLCKSGNKYIRRAAYLAAQIDYNIARNGPHPVGNFVRRVYQKNGIYKHAIVAGCHKLMTIVYAVLTKRQQFIPYSSEAAEIRSYEKTVQRKIADFNKYIVKSISANPIAQFNKEIKRSVEQILSNANKLRILLKEINIDDNFVLEEESS
jgi:transposase